MIGRIRRLAGAAAVVVSLLGVSTTNMPAAQASVAAPAASTEEHQSTATSHGAVTPPSGFVATLKNVHTHQCVDDSFASGLRAYDCNGLNYQEFRFTLDSNGSLEIKNMHTDRCIDDSYSYGLRSYSCNGLDYQQWEAVVPPTGETPFEDVHTHRRIDYSYSTG